MGCDMAKPMVVTAAHVEPEVERTGFSENQIDTIRSTWPLLSRDHVRVGLEVFKRLFREVPSVFSVFGAFSVQNVEELHTCPRFIEHAGKFMAVLGTLVDNLETPQHIDEALLLLGAKHATYDGYHPEYFRFFGKCLLDVWETELGEEFIAEVRESWRLAFDYLVTRMTQGFEMCLNDEIQQVIYHANGAGAPAEGTNRKKHALQLPDPEEGLVRVQ